MKPPEDCPPATEDGAAAAQIQVLEPEPEQQEERLHCSAAERHAAGCCLVRPEEFKACCFKSSSQHVYKYVAEAVLGNKLANRSTLLTLENNRNQFTMS